MNRFASILAIFAGLFLTDAHWLVMQSVSWVEMSRDMNQSIAKVITGESVCDHCRAISEGKQTQENRTFDLLSQAKLLTRLNFELARLPEREAEKLRWHPFIDQVKDPHYVDVPVPPPWA